jgi:hypothetical protein
MREMTCHAIPFLKRFVKVYTLIVEESFYRWDGGTVATLDPFVMTGETELGQ